MFDGCELQLRQGNMGAVEIERRKPLRPVQQIGQGVAAAGSDGDDVAVRPDFQRFAVDFRIFNLLPAFRATREFPLVFDEDPHWNRAGHAFVARTIADYVRSEGLVQPGAARAAPSLNAR